MEMIIFLLLRICLVSVVLAADSSSGLDSFPPFPSPASPLPEIAKRFALVPSDPISGNSLPPVDTQPSLPPPADVAAPPHSDIQPNVSSSPSPSVSPKELQAGNPPVTVPEALVPAATPVKDFPKNSSVIQPRIPVASPPQVVPRKVPTKSPTSETVPQAPVSTPVLNSPPSQPLAIPLATPGGLSPSAAPRHSSNSHHKPHTPEPVVTPVASPPKKLKGTLPSILPVMPGLTPFSSPVPIQSPTRGSPKSPPNVHPILPGESPLSSLDHPYAPVKGQPSSNDGKDNRSPVAAPPNELPKPLPSFKRSQDKGSSPSVAPSTPEFQKHFHHSTPSFPSSSSLPSSKHHSFLVPSPLPSFHRHQQEKKSGSGIPPSKDNAPLPLVPGSLVSPSHSPISSSMNRVSPALSPSSTQVFPLSSKSRPPNNPPFKAFPPPPPNADCSSTICVEPYTNTLPGSPCGCVWPMQVALRLSVALYTFFPSVSMFAQEVAAGVFMKQSQVRIMGANAASEQPDKSIVLVDLVPIGEKFDNTTALLTYQRFWRKKIFIDASVFGDYEVLYVRYPGLPSSPPFPHSGITSIDNGPYSGNGGNGRNIKPLGVNVPKREHKKVLNGGTIAVIVISASTFVGLCFAVVWVLLFKQRDRPSKLAPPDQSSFPSLSKPSGSTRSVNGSPSSASLSFESSIASFTLSAKTFTATEIGRATNGFDESRVLGEGGFGRVYSGVLEDGTKVAVKVLKRVDQQGSREFLAEVKMLSRLHHRNLVNLIGICIEERQRCLVYELIPNGSVDSHLHGVDKESSLDWDARLKIALGAARGLAYLHEDSSPRVIHRDFKSSNILLEHDFTPKVSDFGLARAAMEEENRHISTRVMGTFGYVAPEYAMTGHLLVKSDVYSYGVVLLELLTGRKPVDMTQPPGQENLVSWTRPLLTSREGLEAIMDLSLGPNIPFDSVAKVAAIASMCVQPEVSHRPFMGEVVQALKLVCNECDEAKELASVTSTTQEDLSFNMAGDDPTRIHSSGGSGGLAPHPLLPNYDSEPDIERGVSVSEMYSGSGRLERATSTGGSFRKHSSSGPLTTGRGKNFWQRIRRLSGGSISEYGTSFMLRSGSH